MKIPLDSSKFGENLEVKEMLTQSMRQNLPVSQNKSRLPGRRGVRDLMPSICGTGGSNLCLPSPSSFLGGAFQGVYLGPVCFLFFYFYKLEKIQFCRVATEASIPRQILT